MKNKKEKSKQNGKHHALYKTSKNKIALWHTSCYIMVYEDQQKYAHSGTDGTGSCEKSGGRLFSHQKSPQIHAAATACVPNCQRITRSRLSRHPHYAQRVVGLASNPLFATHPAFHNTLCSKQATVAKAKRRGFVTFNPTAMSRPRVTERQIKTGRNRFDRNGNPPCISLLYSPLQTPLRALQTAISKAFGYLRHIQSSVAGHGYRSRTKTRLCRRRIDVAKRIVTTKVQDASGRCRLRVGAFSQTLSRAIEHPKYHSHYATWSIPRRWLHQSSDRILSQTNAKQFSKELIWPAVADRNGLQHAQTQSGQFPSCAISSQPDPRNSSAYTDSQPDDSQTSNLSSIQSKTISCFALLIEICTHWRKPS